MLYLIKFSRLVFSLLKVTIKYIIMLTIVIPERVVSDDSLPDVTGCKPYRRLEC